MRAVVLALLVALAAPVAFVGAHATPQAPQSVAVSSGVSHPSSARSSQSSKPVWQVPISQPAGPHVPLATWSSRHESVQPWQCVTVPSFVSHPLVGSTSQRA